jgi:hypothetical protein
MGLASRDLVPCVWLRIPASTTGCKGKSEHVTLDSEGPNLRPGIRVVRPDVVSRRLNSHTSTVASPVALAVPFYSWRPQVLPPSFASISGEVTRLNPGDAEQAADIRGTS